MTLSPVFRSAEAVAMLQREGFWDRMASARRFQAGAVQTINEDLRRLIDARFLEQGADAASDRGPDAEMTFQQDFFFLILFLSIFESMGIAPERLPFYGELNFCIKGTITAADNLFDDQAKTLLPLRMGDGARFGSILQLMCFERLTRRAGDRAAVLGWLKPEDFERVQRGLLDQMAEIGRLEGSEEKGVREIPSPEAMVESVHRVRGGMLFGLAMVASEVLESGEALERLRRAGSSVARLGTAFQIVDDLTDFEFDLTRHSHNLLVAQIHHHGSDEEKSCLKALWAGEAAKPGLVEGLFAPSARAVLQMARTEARASLEGLESMGFWLTTRWADPIVQAIVGLDGVERMNALNA